jgi:hypothetical protein
MAVRKARNAAPVATPGVAHHFSFLSFRFRRSKPSHLPPQLREDRQATSPITFVAGTGSLLYAGGCAPDGRKGGDGFVREEVEDDGVHDMGISCVRKCEVSRHERSSALGSAS